MPATDIIPLDEARIPAASAMLARAFFDDPLHAYYFPDPGERAAGAAAVFATMLRFGVRFGGAVVTAGEMLGASAWVPPGQWDLTPERAAAIGLTGLPAVIGEAAAERLLRTYMTLHELHADLGRDHWYGVVGGVVPEARGRWISRALLEPLVRSADEAGQGCYLETCNPVSMKLYTRGAGFRLLREVVDPGSGVRFWMLIRDPRTGAAAGTVRAQRPR